ncbi:MAG: carboxynorspermidine decarboxylase [Bacteroidetes bacterium]|nr:carboxynorspermidine decarboxylase [Bacteroidota bacterium]
MFAETFKNQAADLPVPSFVLVEQKLVNNLEKLRSVRLAADIDLICALKGFAMHAAFPLIAEYLSGASASSLHEARLIYEQMGTKAHTYCAVYLPAEFDEILEVSKSVTFNSLSEYERYAYQVHSKGITAGIRVNPGYSEITTKLYDPAEPASRLGVGPDALINGLPEGMEGLHFHVLCENDSYTLERVLKSLESGFAKALSDCKWVNFGGGHLITREDYNSAHLIKLLKDFSKRHDVKIILEPGSAIAWETGYLVSSVLDIVKNGGKRTAMLDVSFTCHMPDCLEMPYKPAVKGESTEGYAYSLGGMSCLAGDYMDGFFFEQPLNIGDPIIFEDMMHYTMVKTTTFNGVNLPSIVTLKSDRSIQLNRSFGFNDYKNRLS